MFGPSRRCASVMFSRNAHSFAPGPRDCATTASRDDARLRPPRRARLRAAAASGDSAALSSACTSTYHGWPGSGSGSAGMMLARQRERECADISSKPVSAVAERLPATPQQRDRRRRRRRRAASAVTARPRRGKQLQHRGGDDAERAFGADEELLQVVAGVVLAQAAQAVPDRGRRQARLRARARARACCRSAAPRCRRRWSTGCRRSCSCPRTPATAETTSPASAAASCTAASVAPGLDGDRRVGRVERADAIHPR